MPMSRYEIRNEYSLADPELYQTADKDDPEALLEGVAMAGLVGLLRQLGDLAEFAAEVFHNLHEEVVATGARGHGLMVRVQQLEAEIPSVEKEFLSQTDHYSFFYHSGVDWHPNIRTDQNLVTQGDLPRFVMDSYEECREPPRLFLLDKFDVAGAGACLKRYTDPSFYKIESIDMSNANMQREKKILKAKRKGPRWKNEEVPETLPVSHAKLHQLFVEERVENRVSSSSSRVKLKRRLNGYPLDGRTGKSYMEKLLRSSSPDREVVYEVTKDSISTPLMLITNEQDEPKSEVIDDRELSPARLSVRRKRSLPSSPAREKIMKPNDIPADETISEPPVFHHSTEADEMSTHDNGSCESVTVLNADNKRKDNSLLGYHSDDISSEIDYVDAPSTVETEMDTDSEMKAKGGSTSSSNNNQPLAPDANEDTHYSRSDFQSHKYSLSDAGSSSPKKEMSNYSSDSSSITAENSLYEKTSVENFTCADIPEIEVVDSLSDKSNAEEQFSPQKFSETMVHEGAFTGLDAVTVRRSEFEHATYSMSSSDSPPTVADSDSVVVRKDSINVRRLHNTVSSLDDEEKKTIPITDHHSSVADSDSQEGDGCPEPSEHPLDESDCKSMYVSLTADPEPLPGMVSLDNQQPGDLDHEFLEWPENPTGKHPDMTQNKNNIMLWVSDEDVKDKIEIKTSNVSTLEPEFGETSLSGDRTNNVENSHTNSFIDNQLCSEESNSIHLLDSNDLQLANLNHTKIDETGAPLSSESCEIFGLDGTCAKVNVPLSSENLEEAAENYLCNNQEKLEDFSGNSFPTTEKIDEHVEIICSAPEKLEAAEALCSTQEELEEPAQRSSDYTPENSKEPAENSCIPEEIEVSAETSCSTPKKLNDIVEISFNNPDKFDEALRNSCSTSKLHDEPVCSSPTETSVLDESNEGIDKENSEEIASAIPAMLVDSMLDNNGLALNSEKMDVENILNSEDLGSDEPENDENVLPSRHLESGFMEDEVDQIKTDTSVPDAVFLNRVNDDHRKPVAGADIKHNSHLNLQICNPTTIQSLPENGGLDQEFCDEGGLLNSDYDAPLHGNHNREKSLLPEKFVLLPEKLDRELSESGEVSRFPIKQEQMMNHNNEELVLQGKDNLPPDHLGQELQCSGGTRLDSSPQSPISHQDTPKLHNEFSLLELQRQHNYEFDLPVYPNNALAPNFPPRDPFTGTDQINLTDLPPLPPLPPVQWRLGKLQQSLSATEESMSPKDSFSQEISESTDDSSITVVSANESLVQMVPPEIKEEKVENILSIAEFNTINETSNITGNKRWQFVPKDSSISAVYNSSQITEHPPNSEDEQQKKVVGVPSSDAETSVAADEDRVVATEVVLTQSSLSGIDTSNVTVIDLQQPEIDNQKRQLVLPRSEIETTPAEDDGVASGVRSLKARLPSPLIDDASVLDKSKLRKVAERVRPELKKVDERDSFLQQIKTKSFNLKPAVTSRPSIRGPSTNLKVAAILEKANAIRQALAGSDEDEDSWSDS